MGKSSNYRIHKKDSIEDAIDKNESLIRRLVRLEKELKKIKSQNRTLKDAWQKTEDYLVAISEDKKIEVIFEEIDTKTSLRKVKQECPNSECNSKMMNKRKYDGYDILSCLKCGYRNRVNEGRSSKAKKD